MPCFCATVCPSESKSSKIMHRVVTSLFEAARTGRRQLGGFPDIKPLLAELQMMSSMGVNVKESEEYTVTVPQPDGVLVIKESFFDMFAEEMQDFWDVVNDFNQKYNPEHRRLNQVQAAAPTAPQIQKAELVQDDETVTTQSLNSLPDVSGS